MVSLLCDPSVKQFSLLWDCLPKSYEGARTQFESHNWSSVYLPVPLLYVDYALFTLLDREKNTANNRNLKHKYNCVLSATGESLHHDGQLFSHGSCRRHKNEWAQHWLLECPNGWSHISLSLPVWQLRPHADYPVLLGCCLSWLLTLAVMNGYRQAREKWCFLFM